MKWSIDSPAMSRGWVSYTWAFRLKPQADRQYTVDSTGFKKMGDHGFYPRLTIAQVPDLHHHNYRGIGGNAGEHWDPA